MLKFYLCFLSKRQKRLTKVAVFLQITNSPPKKKCKKMPDDITPIVSFFIITFADMA